MKVTFCHISGSYNSEMAPPCLENLRTLYTDDCSMKVYAISSSTAADSTRTLYKYTE